MTKLTSEFGIKYDLPEDQDVISIGRNHSNDVVIPPVPKNGDPRNEKYILSLFPDKRVARVAWAKYRSVSKQHAVFERHGLELWIRDNNSSYGTEVNGKKVSVGIPLQDGDSIKLGELYLTFFNGDTEAIS